MRWLRADPIFSKAVDGACPACGYDNGTQYGAFDCRDCGQFIEYAKAPSRPVRMAKGNWHIYLVGGIVLAAVVIALGTLADPYISWEPLGLFRHGLE